MLVNIMLWWKIIIIRIDGKLLDSRHLLNEVQCRIFPYLRMYVCTSFSSKIFASLASSKFSALDN